MVSKFPQTVFEKLVIPSDLYKMLVDDYERVQSDMTEEVCIQTVINCQEIQDLGDESIVRRTSGCPILLNILETSLSQTYVIPFYEMFGFQSFQSFPASS